MPRKAWPYYYPSGKKVPASIRKKFRSCLKQVRELNKRIISPYAICTASIKLKKKKR